MRIVPAAMEVESPAGVFEHARRAEKAWNQCSSRLMSSEHTSRFEMVGCHDVLESVLPN